MSQQPEPPEPRRLCIVVEVLRLPVRWAVRTRRVLKRLLRGYGLRCVSITELPEPDGGNRPCSAAEDAGSGEP